MVFPALSADRKADIAMTTRSITAGLAVVLLGQGIVLHTPVMAQTAVASQAQVAQIDKRVGTLESQMRAVQRQVFPGGDKRFFAPEIVPEAAPVQPAGTPASPPLVDLTQRVTALETQQRQFTGQVEQLQFQMRQFEAAMQKLRGDAEFRLDALEGKAPGAAGAAGAALMPGLPAPEPVRPGAVPKAAAPVVASPFGATVAAQAPGAGKDAARGQTAAGPQTGKAAGLAGGPGAARLVPDVADPVEAAYLRGYGLYAAGNHAAAAGALSEFVKTNPRHMRASNAQFWAGRAMMAQGKTPEAAKAFLSGYQQYPRGERAHNSLLWLGKSLVQMNQPKAACQALDQLRTAYPDRLTGQFAADTSATRAEARCGT